MVNNEVIEIPTGYVAVEAFSSVLMYGAASESTSIDLVIGRSIVRHTSSNRLITHGLNSETGNIPIALAAFRTSVMSVAIEIKCRRTIHKLNNWKLSTYEKIQEAYNRSLADYNEQLVKISLQTEEKIRAGNPQSNRKRIATEIKREAISIISNKRHLLDGIDNDTAGIPYINIERARNNDPLIRFLEQAFEWENMSYIFYPYFWGRKDPFWVQKVLFDTADPEFSDFIRAGAARVQLPVRPGFEQAVDHFTKTCEPWDGGELPDITDETYLPFVEEHKAQLGSPGNEKPVDEPWVVKIPTNLVYLKETSVLPKWQINEGKWFEVPEED